MLTTNEIAGFKEALEKEKALLETELGTLGRRDPSRPDDWIPAKPEGDTFGADRNDNADIIEDMVDQNATLTKLEARLITVNQALEAIEEGTYGTCRIGGDEIEKERLTANPAADTCTKHMNV